MRLHEDPQAFRATVLSCASALDMAPAFVAKDYYIVLILREIVSRSPIIVFKGGTALSKCHHAIARFSEDVDLGLETEHPTEGMRKSMKRYVVDAISAVGLEVENLDQTRSKREYNRFIVPLPPLGKASLEPLIVETAVVTPASPTVRMPVSMILRDWAEVEGLSEGLSAYEGTAPFDLLVNSVERTFLDKVFAICDYYLDDVPIPPRQSRHIYDLYELLNLVKLNGDLARLFQTVRAQRLGRHRCPSAELIVNIAAVLEEIAASNAYEDDYVNITEDLLYEHVPYAKAVTALTEIATWIRSEGI